MNSSRNLVILVFNIACVSMSLATSCPYQVQACECQFSSVICNNLDNIPPLHTGGDITVVNDATFNGGNIISVANTSLPAGLTTLTFESHPLTNISDDAFQASATTLNELWINDADFARLPEALGQLTKLSALILANTNIQDWNPGALQHIATTVTSLSLVGVGLSAWPKWLLLSRSLKTVDFSKNNLNFIPEDAFISCNSTLNELNLRNNNITLISKSFLTLRNLTSLDLSENSINNVDSRAGVELLALAPFATTLLTLTLESIGMTVIPNFSNFTRLENIYLGNNQISDSTSGLFPLTTTAIDLKGNKLSKVPTTLANLPYLSSLDLSYNEITKISFDIFPLNLTVLEISYNKITEISEALDTNGSLLNNIFLSSNPISIISTQAFKNLLQLSYLYLDQTNLTEFPLALTSLARQVSLSMTNIPSLNCPCPPRSELVQWYKTTSSKVFGLCNNGEKIDDYLKGSCQIIPPTTPASTTSTTGHAPTNVCSVCCRYVCLILLLGVYLSQL